MPFKCAAAICVVVVAFVCGGSSVPSEPSTIRVKRSLTTICVEIKPSRPQEEPYLMCKGAELPSYPQSSWPLTGFGLSSAFKQLTAPTFIDSYSPDPSGDGGIQQLTPTSMYNGKSQSFHPPTDSSYYSRNDNNNNNYRPVPDTLRDKYESGFSAASQQSHQQQQQQFFSSAKPIQVAYEASPTTPSATDAQTYGGNGYGNGHQLLQLSSSPATPTTHPATGSATQSPAVVYAAPTVHSQPQPQPQPQPYPYQVPSAYNNGAHFSATDAASQQPNAYAGYGDQQRPQQRKNQQQSNSSGGGIDGSYAPPSPTAALSGTQAEKPFAPQTVNVGHGEIPPAVAPESAQRTAAASAVSGNAAITTTTTPPAPTAATAGYVAPAAPAAAAAYLKAGADNFGSGEQYTSAGGGFSETLSANTAISSAPASVDEQRYRALNDENVQGMPDWQFNSEEFNLYRPMSSGAHRPPQTRAFISAAAAEAVQPYWSQSNYGEHVLPQQRTIPVEHMDDPVMRQFYASLHDPPAPAPLPPLLAAPQFHSPPLLGLARSYPASQLPASSYPPEAGVAGYVCTPTQHSAASDYMDSTQLPPVPVDKQCNSCQSREHGFTPIIIALPCYGQSPSPPPSPPTTVVYGDRFSSPYTYGELPAAEQMTTYGDVSMANPMLGAYPSAQAMSAGGGGLVGSPFGGLGLFGGPPLFPPLGLVRPLFGGGLLGSTQSRPQFFQMRSNNGGQVLNDIVPTQQQTVMPNTAALTTAFSNYPTSKVTTVSTAAPATTIRPKSTVTTESTSQTDSNESAESIEELKDKAKSEEALSASQEQQSSAATTRPRAAKVTADMEPALGDTIVTPELPPNLGEETTKTFKTMMQAARTLTNIHKGEKDTTAYAENSNSNQDRLTKDPYAKASSTGKPNADW